MIYALFAGFVIAIILTLMYLAQFNSVGLMIFFTVIVLISLFLSVPILGHFIDRDRGIK